MSAQRLPHFEILRSEHPTTTKAGNLRQFWARLCKNGVIWDTPLYVHKAGARRAIEIACGPAPGAVVPIGDLGLHIWHNGYETWLRVDDLTTKGASDADRG